MTLQVKYLEGDAYLGVELSGMWDDAAVKQIIEAIRDEATRRNQTKIFLDLRNFLPPAREITRYLTGEYIAKFWGHPFRVVALAMREYYDGFAEDVARNRGADIRVFFAKDEALKWLLS